MSSPLWRGGILARRQAPAHSQFSVARRRRKQRVNTGGTAQHHSGTGRVQVLYKNKGDRNETKSYRGILVQDLPGAMHASF